MRRFSAQYVITNTGPVLKRAIITVDETGKITQIEDTGGSLAESRSVEFYNGILIPGFVNCHCHLELSGLRKQVKRGEGLATFIGHIRNSRGKLRDIASITEADREMFHNGISLCADICNTSITFGIKAESRITYVNLLEVFGIDPGKASKRMREITALADEAERAGMNYSIVPHSAYAVSVTLFRLLNEVTRFNKVTSIHFMESESETVLLQGHGGPLLESYRSAGLLPAKPELVSSHREALDLITSSGNLVLVHSTFAGRETIRLVQKSRKDLFWCLCPGSNSYIEGRMPPVDLLREEECEIVTGTDSLASNDRLDILAELKMLQKSFPHLDAGELIQWGTINGARALGMEDRFGKLEKGMSPGILLLQDADLINMKLTGDTSVIRLV